MPEERSPFENRIWQFYTEEEKSITLLNAFKHRHLFSEEVSTFLFRDRVNTWATWGFPIATFAGLYKSGVLKPYIAYKYPKRMQVVAPLLITALLQVGWSHYSPFYRALQNEKLELLEILERRIGVKMKMFNDIVPRTWTCQEIHRQMRETYNDRNGLFTNILYPSEEGQAPLQDISTYSFKYRRDRLVK